MPPGRSFRSLYDESARGKDNTSRSSDLAIKNTTVLLDINYDASAPHKNQTLEALELWRPFAQLALHDLVGQLAKTARPDGRAVFG